MEERVLSHGLTLQERNRLNVTGVAEVVHFEDSVVALRTSQGVLVVQGQELKLKKLSPEGGQVAVEGKVSALSYEEQRSGRSFWGRRSK